MADPRLRLVGLGLLVVMAVGILLTTYRPDPTTGQERSERLAGALDAAHTIEQTFTAGRDGLSTVEIYARIPPGSLNPGYRLTLSLREDTAREDLASVRQSLVAVRSNQRLRLTFSPQMHAKGKTYRLRIETNAPPDTVSLLSSSDDALPEAELRIAGQSQLRDLSFRTYTALLSPDLAAELLQSAPEFGLLLLLTLIFAITGGALLSLLGVWPEGSLAERAIWSVGAGLAFVPLAYLLAGRWTWGVLAVVPGLALVRWVWRLRGVPVGRWLRLPRVGRVDIALLAIFLLSLVVHLLQVRDVPVPMWVDGLEHVGMVQTLLELGRVPGGLIYHLGYHMLVALFRDLFTGLPLPRLMVLIGQWIGTFGGVAVYFLAKRTAEQAAGDAAQGSGSPSRLAGLCAVLALSLFSSLPVFLVSWGRYPFLLGLALLPLTLAAALDALRSAPSRASLARYALAGLLLGGQILCHYGTLSFWLSFVVVFFVTACPAWVKQIRLRQGLGIAGILLALAVLGLTLRFGDNLAGHLAETIAQSRQTSSEIDQAGVIRLMVYGGGAWLAVAGMLGWVWAVLKARPVLVFTAVWFTTQALLVAVQAPLLGYALASYTNLFLALSLPLAVLAGCWMALLLRPFSGTNRGRLTWAAGSLLVVLALSGGLIQMGMINLTALLYGPVDARAAEWIQSHTPTRARFLINGMGWSGDKIVPADGGGWIPILTGREAVTTESRKVGANPAMTLQNERIQYVYLGRAGGFLSRAVFAAQPDAYRLVYNQGGVQIYQVTSPGP